MIQSHFRTVGIGLFLLISLIFTACNNSDKTGEISSNYIPDPPEAAEELPDAPDFTLESYSGDLFTLSDHDGKVIVINIWATWCPPCREEIPDFMEIQEEMKDDGVLFVGVATDQEGWEVVRPFTEEFQINYPIVVDNGTVANLYGPIRGIPMSFIINKEGKVEHYIPGMIRKADLKPILTTLVNR